MIWIEKDKKGRNIQNIGWVVSRLIGHSAPLVTSEKGKWEKDRNLCPLKKTWIQGVWGLSSGNWFLGQVWVVHVILDFWANRGRFRPNSTTFDLFGPVWLKAVKSFSIFLGHPANAIHTGCWKKNVGGSFRTDNIILKTWCVSIFKMKLSG